MARIFISYSKLDRDSAQAVARAFLNAGHAVWWDHDMISGENFRRRIMEELAAADRVVVIWTKNSVQSEWVISEASRAAALGKLLQLKAADVGLHDLPPPFDTLHFEAIDALDRLLAQVAKMSGAAVQVETRTAEPASVAATLTAPVAALDTAGLVWEQEASAFSDLAPGGQHCASKTEIDNKKIIVRAGLTGRVLWEHALFDQFSTFLSFSSSGKYLFLKGDKLGVFDAGNGKKSELDEDVSFLDNVATAGPMESVLFVRGLDCWSFYSLPSLQRIHSRTPVTRGSRLKHLADYLFVSAVNAGCEIIDVMSGEKRSSVRFLPHTRHAGTVSAFEFDGRYLVSGDADGCIKQRVMATGELIRDMMGHSGRVMHLSLSPDRKFVASGGDDGVVNVWDLGNGRRLFSRKAHEAVKKVAFSARREGPMLLSLGREPGGSRSAFKAWHLDLPA